jgi:class 3 adenylate cyclase
VWLLFLALDYFYLPKDFFWLWMSLRFSVAALWLLTPFIMRSAFFLRHYQFISAINLCLTGFALNVMIRFDAYPSVYILSLILCHQMGAALLKIKPVTALLCSIFVFGMAMVVTTINPQSNFKAQLACSIILIGFIVFNYQYAVDEMELFRNSVANRQMEKNRHRFLADALEKKIVSERISRSFPPFLVEKIKHDEAKYAKFYNRHAVVGLVDVESSAQISNQMKIEDAWDLKALFTETFIEEAKKRGCVPLTWTGDGFMFICNFFGETDWHFRVAALIEGMHQAFDAIAARSGVRVSTGLKFGLAEGEVIVGHLGKQKAFYNAHGTAINLAARLCSEAGKGETVVTEAVYEALAANVAGFSEQGSLEFTPKGWDHPLRAMKLTRDSTKVEGMRCPRCRSKFFTVMSTKGQWVVVCPRCS